jgi:riboflavin kinase/FMN adenylyltransferase
MITPPSGVYITYCEYGARKYPSITNVGFKPTIGEYDKNVETHIFDFDKILYGKNINVQFIKMIRPERKFDNIDMLKKQITDDCIKAKAYHRSVI